MNVLKSLRMFVFGFGIGLVIIFGSWSYGDDSPVPSGKDLDEGVNYTRYDDKTCNEYKVRCGYTAEEIVICMKYSSTCNNKTTGGSRFTSVRDIGRCRTPDEGSDTRGANCTTIIYCAESQLYSFYSTSYNGTDTIITCASRTTFYEYTYYQGDLYCPSCRF